jgi:hypothetical protein
VAQHSASHVHIKRSFHGGRSALLTFCCVSCNRFELVVLCVFSLPTSLHNTVVNTANDAFTQQVV